MLKSKMTRYCRFIGFLNYLRDGIILLERLTGQGGQAFLGERDGVGRGRIVGCGSGGFAVRLDGFVFLAKLLVRLAEQALDKGIVLIGF